MSWRTVVRAASSASMPASAASATAATARTHVGRLFAKLGARHRAQLVVLAYETGLVRSGWAT